MERAQRLLYAMILREGTRKGRARAVWPIAWRDFDVGAALGVVSGDRRG